MGPFVGFRVCMVSNSVDEVMVGASHVSVRKMVDTGKDIK